MPIYEYQCNSCRAQFEKLVRLSQTDGIACPECSATDVKRLMSTFGFTGQGIRSSAKLDGGSCGSCSGGSCSTCGSGR